MVSWTRRQILENWKSSVVWLPPLSLLVLFFGTGNYWSATWLSKWALLEGLTLIAICIWAARKTSLWHLPLMLYVCASLFVLGLWPENPYTGQADMVTVIAVEKNALQGLMEVLFAIILFASIRTSWQRGITYGLALIWLAGTLGVCTLPMYGSLSPPNNGLWFGNPSMGTSLLAGLLPLVWQVYPWCRERLLYQTYVVGTWFLTLLVILRTQASVPWGVLGVTTAAAFFANAGWTKKLAGTLAGIGVLAGAMIFAGMRLLGKDFWDQNGRYDIWGVGWNWFWAHANPYVGQGFSSLQVLLPLQQTIMGYFTGNYFLWLHSDWLQLGLEGGALGMFCVFLSFGRLVWVAWPRPVLFGGLMGFAALGLFNYPLRMPVHCYCLVLICGLAEALHASHSRKSLS